MTWFIEPSAASDTLGWMCCRRRKWPGVRTHDEEDVQYFRMVYSQDFGAKDRSNACGVEPNF